jgi:signal transduction histidine kinase
VDDLKSLLWRAIAMFRIVSCGYAALLTFHDAHDYFHPAAGYAVIAVMAFWSVASIFGYAHRAGRQAVVMGADLVVTLGCLLATPWIVPPGADPQMLPMLWMASPALAWGVVGGSWAGTAAALVLTAGTTVIRGSFGEFTLNNGMLLVLPGAVVGYVADLATQVEARSRHAAQLEAATAERERIARAVHDSVLQVLALVQRRGAQIGGPAAELGRLAGEQEAALRALIAADVGVRHPEGAADLCGALREFASVKVTLALPATAILLPSADCAELVAAIRAILDNVDRHAGPDAAVWILAEQDDANVTVTVRDDGPGMAPGRLAQAEAEGRLGIAQSIRGRIHRLGGAVAVSAPLGQGTEIELSLPIRTLTEVAT